ncbi:MAG: sodium:solute symporter [Bacteroidota bacterium]
MDNFSLSSIDLIIIVVYIIGVIVYGLLKAKRSSSEEYFLAGRNMTWPIVGISLFAANIGSHTLIGLSSDAFNGNFSVYNYEWMATVVLVFFAIFFLPFYLRSKVYTMPEFLERRYDKRSRYFFSGLTIIGNVIVDTAAGLYAGNLILKIIFPEVSSIVIIICLALAAAAYTIPGGLNSVVQTEVIQAILLIGGSILLTYFCFTEVGGWSGMMAGLNEATAGGILSKSPADAMSLVRPQDDAFMPWTGLVFGVPILGFYFWANNQFMVQRALGAKDLNHGRWGALFAGLLKLPVVFFMVLPGTVAIVLFGTLDISALNYYIPTEAGGTELCTRLGDCPNMTYPVLIYNLLPTGILGLVIAGLLAAMSSSISATLNSASTLITMDFVANINPNLSSKQLVRVGQIATVILVVLAAAWAPQIERFSSLFEYLQIVIGLIAPPVVAVFLLGLFWKRANGNGALAALVVGFAFAVLSLLSTMGADNPSLSFLEIEALNEVHFLHKAPIILIGCLLVGVVVSLASHAPAAEKLKDMIWTPQLFRDETEELRGMPWYKNFRILAVLLLVITAIVVGAFW